MKHLLMLFTATLITITAQAQDFGVLAGVHSSTASTDNTSVSFKSELGYRLGVTMKYEIKDSVSVRSGLTYTARSLKSNDATNGEIKYAMNYLDVPVLFQFQMNEMFALYVGPVVAINVGKKVTAPSGSADLNGTNSLHILAQAGANFTFDDIGFDVYYERGLGEFATGGKDFSILGANFLFWF